MVVPRGILAHAYGEERAIHASLAIDDGGGGNSNLRRDLTASVIVACGFARAENRGRPELCAAVGIKGIDTVMLGGDVEDVVELGADDGVGEEEWLGVNFTVYIVEADLAELSGVDVALGEDRFFCVQAIAGYVVVESGYVGRIGRHSGLDGERERRRVREGS